MADVEAVAIASASSAASAQGVDQGMRVIRYSEKAIAVVGNSFQFKEQISRFGSWNKGLRVGGVVVPGWIMSAKHLPIINKIVVAGGGSPLLTMTQEDALVSISTGTGARTVLASPATAAPVDVSGSCAAKVDAATPNAAGPVGAGAGTNAVAASAGSSIDKAAVASSTTPVAGVRVVQVTPAEVAVIGNSIALKDALKGVAGARWRIIAQLGGVRGWLYPISAKAAVNAIVAHAGGTPLADADTARGVDHPAIVMGAVARGVDHPAIVIGAVERVGSAMLTGAAPPHAGIKREREVVSTVADVATLVAAPRRRLVNSQGMEDFVEEEAMWDECVRLLPSTQPTVCQDCNKPQSAQARSASNYMAPSHELGCRDPRAALAYCDRRFRLGNGAALSEPDALRGWQRTVEEFSYADQLAASMSAAGSKADDRMMLLAQQAQQERRKLDRDTQIGHCCVIVCQACRLRPTHLCKL